MPTTADTAVLTDLFRPARRLPAAIYSAALVIAGALLIALGAKLTIPLPFTPVPVTAQTLAVVLVGVLLGSCRGSVAALAYLAAGAMGLPVFSWAGCGLAWLLGPTGGYLAGFVAAAWIAGRLAECGFDRRLPTAALAMSAGIAAVYACGLPWLALYVGWPNVLALGLVPFLPGAALKVLVATAVLPLGWKLLGAR